MGIVVSDTSPIRALHHLRLAHLLNVLYGEQRERLAGIEIREPFKERSLRALGE